MVRLSLYFGPSYRLSLVADAAKDLKLWHGEFCLSRRVVENGGVDATRSAFGVSILSEV